jgi:5-methylcytosine-specific restriction endonuclease McrA
MMLHTLRTDKEKKTYVRGVIAAIGVCDSVKAFLNGSYETVLAIVQNHPEATAKLKDIEDFYIKENTYGGRFSKGFTLMIKKKGGGEMDVSYITSATGKGPSPRTVFHSCLRVSIDPQIREFKDNETKKVCALCNKKLTTDTGREADHVKHFVTIVDEFILTRPANFTYPTETKECNDGTYRYRLTDADSELEAAFIVYHEQQAELRITCKKCNQSRGGPEKKAIVHTKKRKA